MIKNKIFLFLLINFTCLLLIVLLKNNSDFISVALVIFSLIINVHSFCLLPIILILFDRETF